MSERIRRSHLKHPFEAKHVIVAGCAAIAMVLGAMSVGGSIPSRQPVGTEVSAIASTNNPAPATSTAVGGTGMTRQHTLEVRDFLQQQSSPLYTTPSAAPTNGSKSITPAFGSSDPLRLINQMVQLQQEQAQPSAEASSASTGATPPEDTTSSGETATTPATSTEDPNDNSTAPGTPDEADQHKSGGESSVMSVDKTTTP